MEGAVERKGAAIIVPAEIPLEKAIETLQRQVKYENEIVVIRETIEGCFWDGAYAFFVAMKRQFGWVHAEDTQTLFGTVKPRMHSIASGIGKTVLVPWGKCSLPGIEGKLETSFTEKDGRYCFVISAEVARRHEATIRKLADAARRIVAEESLYRGKAVRMRFKDDEGDRIAMPEPNFIDVRNLSIDSLILPAEVHDIVATAIFTPIQKTPECRAHHVPLKRGVLLSGPFGTGKTLTAYVTAALCEQNGWTFIYCEKANELAEAIRFAHSYQPAVVFCEDIDQVVAGARSVDMNEILNIVDGIESKGVDIMVILTTNFVEAINSAMLRPGRLDAVIEFVPPDAVAVERLVRSYGRGFIEPETDLSMVSAKLTGLIPAVIKECVERSKLSAIRLGDGSALVITQEALLDAATGMQHQLKLLNRKPAEKSKGEQLFEAFGSVVAEYT